MQHAPKKEKRVFALRSLSDAVAVFLEAKGGEERGPLNALWDDWDAVMGPEIAALAVPLGHKDDTLLLGADDNMAMQELTMMSPEIVGRANAFMDTPFFSSIRVSLVQKKTPLNRMRGMQPAEPEPMPAPPPGFGNLKDRMDPESPVARCYEAYLRMYFP